MYLQKIELPTEYEKERCKLYLRKVGGSYNIQKSDALLVNGASCVSFDTYFNALSAGKWFEYTFLDNLQFSFTGCGRYTVSICQDYINHKEAAGKSFCQKILAELFVDSPNKQKFCMDIPLTGNKDGIIYVKITTENNGEGEFSQGRFETRTTVESKVSLVLDICTYKREEFLYRNLEIIEKSLWNNPESSLYHNLHVIVADNGNTIPTDKANEWLDIYPNKNAGGAAGFTRGMLEAMDADTEYTHILLMDDDVEIKPSAIERTYILLELLRNEYREAIIGGAMLRRDFSFVQQENGACFENGHIRSLHAGLDLRIKENVLLNEQDGNSCTDKKDSGDSGLLDNKGSNKDVNPCTAADYNAWWYCCIPMKTVRDKGLPLPIFIHNDDVEYGLRCNTQILTMNGICVWHEAFENKRPSSNEYYDVRNALIVNALHNPDYSAKQAVSMVCKRMLTNLFRYRYRDITLNVRAACDYLKGPDWLMEQDAQKLHKNIAEAGYHYNEINKKLKLTKNTGSFEDILPENGNSMKIDKKKLISLNGWLLPANKGVADCMPIMAGESPHAYYRVKNVFIYDPDTRRGFYVRKDLRQLFVLAGKMICVSVKLILQYKNVRRQYQGRADEMTGRPFWEKYLEV